MALGKPSFVVLWRQKIEACEGKIRKKASRRKASVKKEEEKKKMQRRHQIVASAVEAQVLDILDGVELGGRPPKAFNSTALKAAWLARLAPREGGVVLSRYVAAGGESADLVTLYGREVTLYEFRYVPMPRIQRRSTLPPPPAFSEGEDEYSHWADECARAVRAEAVPALLPQWRVRVTLGGEGATAAWHTVDAVAEDTLQRVAQSAHALASLVPANVPHLDLVAVVGVGKWVYLKFGRVACTPSSATS